MSTITIKITIKNPAVSSAIFGIQTGKLFLINSLQSPP